VEETKKVKGLAVGAIRPDVPLFAKREKSEAALAKLSETERKKAELVSKLLDRYEAQFGAVRIDVRRMRRRLAREHELTIDAAKSKVVESGKGLTGIEASKAIDKANEELRAAFRAFLSERVKVGGEDLGPVLVAVKNVDVEQIDGSWLDLANVKDLPALFEELEDLDLLELVGAAALFAQEATQAQKN
jgi:hypothetical protein